MIRQLMTTLGLGAVPVAAAKPAPSATPRTIVIIDENPDSLRGMCLALGGESYRVETAETAATALRKLGAGHPDLILLDSRVADTDGTQFARRLLADEGLASVPIVALVELAPGAHTDREAGGRYDGYVRKPIDAAGFADQIRGFLAPSEEAVSPPAPDLPPAFEGTAVNNGEAARLLDSLMAGSADSHIAPGATSSLHQLAAVVDALHHDGLAGYLTRAEQLSTASTVRARSRFWSLVRLSRELVERGPDPAPGMAALRTAYLERRRSDMNGLEHALKNRDFEALRKAGHNLKGTGAAYGFGEITDIGRSLEAAAKDDNAEAIEILLDRIDSYVGIVRPPPGSSELAVAGR